VLSRGNTGERCFVSEPPCGARSPRCSYAPKSPPGVGLNDKPRQSEDHAGAKDTAEEADDPVRKYPPLSARAAPVPVRTLKRCCTETGSPRRPGQEPSSEARERGLAGTAIEVWSRGLPATRAVARVHDMSLRRRERRKVGRRPGRAVPVPTSLRRNWTAQATRKKADCWTALCGSDQASPRYSRPPRAACKG